MDMQEFKAEVEANVAALAPEERRELIHELCREVDKMDMWWKILMPSGARRG